MYSYDITVALANDRRSKLQADAARPRAARAARQARKAARRAEGPLARQRALPPLLARAVVVVARRLRRRSTEPREALGETAGLLADSRSRFATRRV